MEKINVIIIDDEPIAISYIESYIAKIEHLSLIATFNRPLESLPLIESGRVDLIFLDIEMPQITGLEFIALLTKVKPKVILTTAYSQYALEGYNLDAVDYMLKPISFERFERGVYKALAGKITPKVIEESRDSIELPKPSYIFLKSGYKSIKVEISDILYIESSGVYAIYYTIDGHRYMRNERMKNIELSLSQHGFVRIHKSYLINSKYIKSVTASTLQLEDKTLPIGRNFRGRIV